MPSAVFPLAVGPSTTISGRCAFSGGATGSGSGAASGDGSAAPSAADQRTPALALPRHRIRDDLHAELLPVHRDRRHINAPHHLIKFVRVEICLREVQQASLLSVVDALQRQRPRLSERAMPSAHLDKDDLAVTLRDDVQLSAGVPPVPVANGIPGPAQIARDELLCALPEALTGIGRAALALVVAGSLIWHGVRFASRFLPALPRPAVQAQYA